MKRKRYTEDLEFKISDEEADDADAAGRDSPSNTSQSEQQVSGPFVWLLCTPRKVDWRLDSWSPKSSVEALDSEPENVRLLLANVLWEISCLAVSFTKPRSLKFIFI